MKILLTLHTHLDPDAGAPGATLRLAEEYRRRSHDVEVFGFDHIHLGRLPGQAKMVAFPWAVAARLARTGRGAGFDVIDASTGDAWLLGTLRQAFPVGARRALLVARSHGLEHTVDERCRAEAFAGGQPLSWRYPLYHGGYRLREVARSLRSADVALFLNQYDAALAVERLGVSPERARVVRNGIADALIGQAPPAPSPSGGRIAVIGSYIARKGVAYGAAALNAWLPRHPDWSVSFLGTGVSQTQVLADYDPSLYGQISVVPRYDNNELSGLLDGHQIHLFPTLAEGGPLSLIEAMACGLVPVASAVPGVVGAVSDGANALLVSPGEPESIVAALDRLVGDRRLLDRLRAGAHRAAQSYGWRAVAAEQLDIYDSYVARGYGMEVAP